MQQLQFLVERMPNWLRVISPVGPVNERFEMFRKLPAAQASFAPAAPKARTDDRNRRHGLILGGVVLGFFLLLRLISHVETSDDYSQAPQPALRSDDGSDDGGNDAELRKRQQHDEALLARIMATPASAEGH